ncbi:MAG: hypothetical protein MK010_03870 [Erythrobacter sp.]|nr:hypothetical protein [Erythrobacter sp.]
MVRTVTRGPQTGSPPSLEFVPVERLQVDPDYQRATDGAYSRKIITGMVREWKWALCQPLVVARRDDGSLFVLDGQHRHAGAIERGDIPHLPCVILSGIDKTGEASAFVDLNTKRQRLSQLDIFTGMLAAGDEDAKQVAAILQKTGWRIRRSSNTQGFKPGDLVCAPMLARHVKARGPKPVEFALDVLRRAYKEKPVTSSAQLLEALIAYHARKPIPEEAIAAIRSRPPGMWKVLSEQIIEAEQLSRRDALVAAIDRTVGRKELVQPKKQPSAVGLPAEFEAWCDQCDARVGPTKAATCASPFCSLRKPV